MPGTVRNDGWVTRMGGEDRATEMQPGADVCANYLKALGDPCRLKIVRAL